MLKRVLVVVLIATIAGGAGWYALRSQNDLLAGAPTQEDMARAVGFPVMLHLVRGHAPGRSGEIMLVPRPNNYLINDWDLRSLQRDEPEMRTTHPNPWSYLTRVPIVVRGPGVPEGTQVRRAVDISQLAPTYARLLGMDGFDSATCSLEEVVPCDHRGGVEDPPALIFTIVVDGGGWNVLDRYPDAWPNLARIMDEGITYTGATIASSPSTTGALHATFGTGFYPVQHGIPGNVLRDDEGEISDVFLDKENDLRYLEKPAVSELWDEQNDNDALVATVSFENWHLGMIGKGALRDGGDRDIAVLWDRDRTKWYINEDFYELPSYLQRTDIARFESYEEELDGRDGEEDGSWFGHDLEDIRADKNQRSASPAFMRFTGDAIMDVLRNEPFGQDDITDLFWVEMKPPDSAGHAWNMLNPEVEDVVKETDAQIGRIVDHLDATLGRDSYLLAISADHGQQPLADEVGGWRINNSELSRDIVAAFGDVLQRATPADVYLLEDGLRAEGVTAAEIARWLGTYTLGDNIPEGAPGRDLVPADRLDEKLFAGAFSTDFLSDSSLDLPALGPGEYGEHGDFPVTQSGR